MATINVPLVKLTRFIKTNHRLPDPGKDVERRLSDWLQKNKDTSEVKELTKGLKEGN